MDKLHKIVELFVNVEDSESEGGVKSVKKADEMDRPRKWNCFW